MTEHVDNRRFQRVAMDSQATLHINDNKYQSTVIDISLNGLLLSLSNDWKITVGDKASAKILLDSDGNNVIAMQLEVSHIDNDHAGFHCLSIDIDSISKLKRLVELNLGDATLLNRELDKLVKQH